MKTMKTLRGITLILLVLAGPIEATGSKLLSIDRANMLKKHGLLEDAKRQFIDILYGDSNEDAKATALYSLGVMAFNEKDLSLAIDTWKLLVDHFPTSEEGRRVAAGMDYLIDDALELANDALELAIKNEIARSYLRNGDFWSNDIKDRYWIIDSSWLDKAGLAIEWYDKVIEEFPMTSAAKLAYLEKFKIVIASEDRMAGVPYSERFKIVMASENQMDKLISIYENFSKDFPDDEYIPVLQFQIAQKYWALAMDYYDQLSSTIPWIEYNHFFANTKKWLETVVHNSTGFYKQIAEERLKEIDTKRLQTRYRLDKFRRNGYSFPTGAERIPHFAVEWQQDNLFGSTSYYFAVKDSVFTLRGGGIAITRPIEEFDNYKGSGADFIRELIIKEKQ